MSIEPTVSFFAQNFSQTNRLVDLRSQLDDLERQATTQKKYDNYAGFGAQAFSLQHLEDQLPSIQSYLDNINTATNNMDTMNGALTQITTLANNIVSSIHTASTDASGTASLQQQASQAISFIEDLLNTQDANGNYLFAGSNVTSQPYIDNNGLQNNFKGQTAQWLNGTISDNQLFNTTDGFSATQLGLSPSLATTGAVTTQVDQSTTLDYTFKADQSGIQNILRSLTLLANTPYPGPTDVATPVQYQNVISHVLTTLTGGVNSLNGAVQGLTGKYTLAQSMKTIQQSDQTMLTSQSQDMENIDTTTALTQLQLLQTQMASSYQITKIVSQLSLTNYL